MREFGKLHVTKNPENFHRDQEQAAFSLGAMVPGIEDSPDPLLQFRIFFYRDAQYHRLGSTNIHQIPGMSSLLFRSVLTIQSTVLLWPRFSQHSTSMEQ